jgi:ABC-type antimicrobial peptide transport system permease subunit
MDPRRKSSLLWGLVGALSFLVLLQAYHIVADDFLAVPTVVIATIVVALASAALAHVFRPRIRRYAR